MHVRFEYVCFMFASCMLLRVSGVKWASSYALKWVPFSSIVGLLAHWSVRQKLNRVILFQFIHAALYAP